ncbi:MAG: hypothetical protein IIB95_13425, partial [Candidatus Marinimicrobia bacterium]|nr:hypothetical protein [Candidatus Neomarinimicrobiota bacterium]
MENLSQSTRTPYYEESIREKITFIIRNKNKKQSKKVQIFGAVKDLTDSNLDK